MRETVLEVDERSGTVAEAAGCLIGERAECIAGHLGGNRTVLLSEEPKPQRKLIAVGTLTSSGPDIRAKCDARRCPLRKRGGVGRCVKREQLPQRLLNVRRPSRCR
jgi:hypothetical protein